MLIKALSSFAVESLARSPLNLAAGEFADLPLPEARAAIEQGAAREASIDETRAAHESTKSAAKEKPKPARAKKVGKHDEEETHVVE
jgi:hypothetical protein